MRHKYFRKYLLASVLAAALSGCSGGKVDRSNTLTYRFMSDPPSLDPAHSTDTTSGTVTALIFDGLVDLEPVSLEVIPAVALDVYSENTFRWPPRRMCGMECCLQRASG